MASSEQVQAYDYYFQLAAEHHQRRYELAAEHHQRRYEEGYDVGEEPGTVFASRLELELLAARRYGRALDVLHAEALAEDEARQHFQTKLKDFQPPDFTFKVRLTGQ